VNFLSVVCFTFVGSIVMRRIRLSTRQRVALFVRHRGICHICNLPILPGQRWQVSHPIPLGLGGEDIESNRAPAHKRPCHEWQTRITDLPAIAKSRRIYAKHIGAHETRRRLPFGRDDRLKRRMDGQIVHRRTGQPWRPGA
jgi:5-methylcytosine-specific restriction protein A